MGTKRHSWPCAHSFSDRFRVNIVALVRLHVGLHILCRNEPYLMPLALAMRASTGLHTHQMNRAIGHEVQQLFAQKLPAYHNLSAKVKSDQMKNRLAKINADRVQLHGMPPPYAFLYPPFLD